jgi:hypothetical protein
MALYFFTLLLFISFILISLLIMLTYSFYDFVGAQ